MEYFLKIQKIIIVIIITIFIILSCKKSAPTIFVHIHNNNYNISYELPQNDLSGKSISFSQASDNVMNIDYPRIRSNEIDYNLLQSTLWTIDGNYIGLSLYFDAYYDLYYISPRTGTLFITKYSIDNNKVFFTLNDEIFNSERNYNPDWKITDIFIPGLNELVIGKDLNSLNLEDYLKHTTTKYNFYAQKSAPQYGSEKIIDNIPIIVLNKPGITSKNAIIRTLPSINADKFSFYVKVRMQKHIFDFNLTRIENKTFDYLRSGTYIYVIGRTKDYFENNYDNKYWYYVRFFTTEATYHAWIFGDSVELESN